MTKKLFAAAAIVTGSLTAAVAVAPNASAATTPGQHINHQLRSIVTSATFTIISLIGIYAR